MPRALSALYLFDEGLIDSKTANLWADEVWCPSEEETGRVGGLVIHAHGADLDSRRDRRISIKTADQKWLEARRDEKGKTPCQNC